MKALKIFAAIALFSFLTQQVSAQNPWGPKFATEYQVRAMPSDGNSPGGAGKGSVSFKSISPKTMMGYSQDEIMYELSSIIWFIIRPF